MALTTLLDFDRGVYNKIKGFWDNCVYATTDTAFAQAAREMNKKEPGRGFTEDNVKLPLINVIDLDYELGEDHFNMTEMIEGHPHRYFPDGHPDDPQNREILSITSIPIPVTYQIDIWGKTQREAKILFCELLWYLRRWPNIFVDIKDVVKDDMAGSQSPKEAFYLQIESVANNTEYGEFKDKGELWRYTITVACPRSIITKSILDHAVLTFPITVESFQDALNNFTETINYPTDS